jgi:hypothetical protein
MTDCTQITPDTSFQGKGLVTITFFLTPLETECHNLDQTDPEYRSYGQDRQASLGRKGDAAKAPRAYHPPRMAVAKSLQE